MKSGGQYQVFKVRSQTYPTVNLQRDGNASETYQLREIVDTNRDGVPSDGDYGVTGGGETYCIKLTGHLRYEETDRRVSWKWVNARHRFQPTAQVEFRSPYLSRIVMAVEETATAIPNYLGLQEVFAERPLATGAIAAAIAGISIFVKNHPTGRVATGLYYLGAAGATVAAPPFVKDRVETLGPAVTALWAGDTTGAGTIILSNPMGERDLFLVPAMIGGAPALESSTAGVVAGLEENAARALFLISRAGGNHGGLSFATEWGGMVGGEMALLGRNFSPLAAGSASAAGGLVVFNMAGGKSLKEVKEFIRSRPHRPTRDFREPLPEMIPPGVPPTATRAEKWWAILTRGRRPWTTHQRAEVIRERGLLPGDSVTFQNNPNRAYTIRNINPTGQIELEEMPGTLLEPTHFVRHGGP